MVVNSRTFTVLSDKRYLDRGIALYESFCKFLTFTSRRGYVQPSFKVYYLCLDGETYDKIKSINDGRLVPLYIEDEFRGNKDFETLVKNNQSTPEGYSDFHFALGSFFTHHIMEKESPEFVMNVDADIIFYASPDIIFNAMEGKSIGIILHRHNKIGCGVGGYNAGLVYFRNDERGRKCLRWWRDVVMDKNNPWFGKYGTCGDQKYIEFFESFGGVKVLDDNIGHGAPWNLRLYKYFKDKTKIEWDGKVQPLVFIHFSHFNYTEDSYRVARGSIKKKRMEWSLYEPAKWYYDEYHKTLKDVKKRYSL